MGHNPAVDMPPWLEHLSALEGRVSELAGAIRGLSLNGILYSGLDVVDATGLHKYPGFSVPFAAVGVLNLGAGAITVAAASADSQPPANGLGVFRVPSEKFVLWPVTGSELTIYGAAGQNYNLLVSAKPLNPMVG